jgi:hypothetical protein
MNSETRMAPARHVEAAFGGALLASLRHQAGGVRAEPQRDRRHLVGRRHLEIERLCETLHQARHVVVPDMAAVLAQMRRDAVGARRYRDLGRAQRIGMPPAARVAQGRHMVDVDPKAQLRHGPAPASRPRRKMSRSSSAMSPERNGDALHECLPARPSVIGSPYSITRSTFATTGLARSWAMIAVRCFRS